MNYPQKITVGDITIHEKAIERAIRAREEGCGPDRIFRYFSLIQNKIGKTEKYIVHLHTTRGWGLVNDLAALQAGMTNFEATLGESGGSLPIL